MSEIENRTLAQRPELTLDNFINKSFSDEFTVYVNDQFFGRDLLIKLYTKLKLIQHKAVINNIVVAEDGWLLGFPRKRINEKILKESANAINSLAAEFPDTRFIVCLVPHKSNMLEHRYPKHLPRSYGRTNYDMFISFLNHNYIDTLNIRDNILSRYEQHEIEEMYFKTDHHWNFRGAFTAYQIIISSLREKWGELISPPLTEEKLEYKCYQGATFQGSYNIHLFNLIPETDQINYLYIPSLDRIEYFYAQRDGIEHDSIEKIFNTVGGKNTVRYNHLFSIDYAEMKYTIKKSQNDLNVLIIKDSYMNALTPLFAQHFKHTTFIDPRHFSNDLSNYIYKNRYDLVLIMYNDTVLTGKFYEF